MAGLTLSFERLGNRFAPIVRMTITTLAVASAGIALIAWLAWPCCRWPLTRPARQDWRS
jgi:hypothetical protein